MAHHHDIPQSQHFNFTGKAKGIFIGTALVGAVMAAISVMTDSTPAAMTRFWANFLLSNFFFTAISVLALAFMCIKYAAKASWAVGFKRLTEAFTGYLPVAAVFFGIMVIFTFVGNNSGFKSLYEWLHPEIVEHDAVLQGKAPYLNLPFFLIRLVVCFLVWIVFQRVFRSFSLKEEQEPKRNLKFYDKSTYWSAAFLPLFGLTFCFAAFDWFMSSEPHWYSTMYAVNVFAGSLVSFCTITIIALILLQRHGYFQWVTANHYHDLGKFVFGFSIFWAYTWVSQFLLIWYANLPEEIPYYLRRMQGNWIYVFFGNFIINFALPLLALMMRDGKRMKSFLLVICIILVAGRFLDIYLLIMPGTVGQHSGFGLSEIGFWLFFAGIFGFTVSNQLTKANLIPAAHPLLEESLHYEI